jgi:hypothetical protein
MQTMKKRLDGRNLLGVDHIHTLPPATHHLHIPTYYTHTRTPRSARPAGTSSTTTHPRHGTPRHDTTTASVTPDAARKPPLQTAHETWRNPHLYREFQASARFESVESHITRARVYPLSAQVDVATPTRHTHTHGINNKTRFSRAGC